MAAFPPPQVLVPAFLLLSTSLFGVRALHIFSFRNGVFNLFFKALESRRLPSGTPFQAIDTAGRFKTADQQICAFAVFMLAFTDNLVCPDVTLAGFLFLGAWGPSWVLIVLESCRNANQGHWLSHLVIPGYIIFHHSHAFGTPLYLCLLILFSPSSQPSHQTPENMFVSPRHLLAMPPSFILGYIVPLILMALPAPTLVSYRFKHTATGWYQQWHIIIAVIHYTIFYLLSTWSPSTSEASTDPETTLSLLAVVYMTALTLATIPYWTVTIISFTSLLAPSLFDPKVAAMITPRNVLVPTSPWRKGKVPNMQTGFKWLIQWDYIIGTLGTFIWAFTLWVYAKRGIFHNTTITAADWARLVMRMIMYLFFGGPNALPIGLMWERDCMVFRHR